MKRYTISLTCSKSEYNEIKKYFEIMSVELMLYGIRFSYNRHRAQIGGFLNPGRKSIVKKETSLITTRQAKIRLKNWKMMIKHYREKGYSYPTISRIKKKMMLIANNKR
jgi:hypothetical protein